MRVDGQRTLGSVIILSALIVQYKPLHLLVLSFESLE